MQPHFRSAKWSTVPSACLIIQLILLSTRIYIIVYTREDWININYFLWNYIIFNRIFCIQSISEHNECDIVAILYILLRGEPEHSAPEPERTYMTCETEHSIVLKRCVMNYFNNYHTAIWISKTTTRHHKHYYVTCK